MPDEITADIYAQIGANLEKRIEKIPENDVWIAAIALEFDMTLAHGDAHFDRVHGLDHLRWTWLLPTRINNRLFKKMLKCKT